MANVRYRGRDPQAASATLQLVQLANVWLAVPDTSWVMYGLPLRCKSQFEVMANTVAVMYPAC